MTESLLPSPTTRTRIVVSSLLFCWTIIAYLILGGDPLNSLHTSALAWAFGSAGALVGAWVFGAVYDNKTILAATSAPTAGK